MSFLEKFFYNLLTDTNYELKNRFLHVDYEKNNDDTLKKDKGDYTLEEQAIVNIIRKNSFVKQEEIAKQLEVSKEEIVISLDAIQEPISLQEPAYSENTENIYIIDQVKDKKNTDELWTQNITIAESMKRLNEKERMIINKRFFEGRTQIEVAEEIGISQAQVSRLERTAINHIKRIYK